jgi:hypothetical protein
VFQNAAGLHCMSPKVISVICAIFLVLSLSVVEAKKKKNVCRPH